MIRPVRRMRRGFPASRLLCSPALLLILLLATAAPTRAEAAPDASGPPPALATAPPEAAAGGAIGRVRDGDVIRVDANAGVLQLKVGEAELVAREAAPANLQSHHSGLGRELFSHFRHVVGTADRGASVFGEPA